MPTKLRDLEIGLEYRTAEDDLVQDFYEPCLGASDQYDRAVGYFRSSVFSLAKGALVRFARREGEMRMVCSPDLKEEDVEAIYQGLDNRRLVIGRALKREINKLIDDDRLRARTKVLATLVEVGALKVKVAFRTGGRGNYHEKIGIFQDSQGDRVTFKGSSNETWDAWHEHGNLESFDVFCSWSGGTDEERSRRHANYFDRLWDGEVSGLDVKPIPEIAKDHLLSIAEPGLEDLDLEKEDEEERGTITTGEPWSSLPYAPFPHQEEALENWKDRGKKGILKHATGSGKTYTAVLALYEHLRGGGTALVVVPSNVLLQQWMKEIKFSLGDVDLLLAGGGNSKWKKDRQLQAFTSPESDLGRRIVLSTLQTARTENFRRNVRDGNHLMIVVDEVHRSGSEVNSNIYTLDTGSRLGLSATPRRYGDPAGTQKIFSYFDGIVEPVFTLEDAIREERLVEYTYHPHTVPLRPEEAERWDSMTQKVRKEYARCAGAEDEDGSVQLSERLKHLLIQRARIAKKAESKLDLAEQILDDYQEEERWLVYCEDTDQLDELYQRVRDKNFSPIKYHSKMTGGKEETLEFFKEFGGVLLSIRCLDEGVDIPRTTHALILSSSKNPREFVQRRGRVLRIAPDFPDKRIAHIHDALVVPRSTAGEADRTSLVKTELSRALQFANTALNSEAASEIEDIAIERDINLDEVEETGIESSEEDE